MNFNSMPPPPPLNSTSNTMTIITNSVPANATATIKFKHARGKSYFFIEKDQEMNSLPYKYNILLENIQAAEQHYVGLYVIGPYAHQVDYIPDGIIVEKLVRKTDTFAELRIALQAFSYAFDNRSFVIMLFDSSNKKLQQTNSFHILARKNRKRTEKLKNKQQEEENE